jgi:16S rRNA processing protein RimM
MRRPSLEPEAPSTTASEQLPLGVLGRAHGIRGDLIFRPFNPQGISLGDLDLPLAVTLRMREGGIQTWRLLSARPFKEGDLVRFEGIDSPEAASRLTNAELAVPRAVLPPLREGEYYVADLAGCAAVDVDGKPRGVVRGCFWNGTQDVLEIVGDDGAELLVPAVGDFLRAVDLSARRIVVQIDADDD